MMLSVHGCIKPTLLKKNHTYLMSSVFHSSQHFLGLHKSVSLSLHSYFRIFLGIYINIKKKQIKNTDLYDLNFVENKE